MPLVFALGSGAAAPPRAAAAAAPPLAPARLSAAPAPRLPARRAAKLRPQAAAAPVAPTQLGAAMEGLFQATGVPLVDELMGLGSLPAAVQHSTRLAGIALAVGVLGTVALRAAGRAAAQRAVTPAADSAPAGFNPFAAAAAAALIPSKVLLPYCTGGYLLTLGASLAQVAAMRRPKDFARLCCGSGDEVLALIKRVAQLLQDTTELLGIVFAAWALIEFKNRVVQAVAAAILTDEDHENDAVVVSFLRPLSSILNLAIGLGAGVAVLGAYGINLAPVLASLGGLGIVVGLASQAAVGNLLSSFALYTARPYMLGDEVVLLRDEKVVLQGTVSQVEPLRTIMQTEDDGLVYINNSDVSRLIIKNMTQGRALQAMKAAPPPADASEAEAVAAELLHLEIASTADESVEVPADQ